MSEKTFSERNGLAPEHPLPQEGISDTLRICLWNVVLARLFGKLGANQYGEISQDYHIFINLQRNFFKLPMDEFEKHLSSRREWYKDVFFTLDWWRVFDFFEFVARKMIPYDAQEWERDTNAALTSEGSAYRLVGGSVIPVGEPLAANALSETLNVLEAQSLSEALSALKDALALFSKARETKIMNKTMDSNDICAKAKRAVSLACEHATATQNVSLEEAFGDAALAIPGSLQKAFLSVFGNTEAREREALGTDTEVIEAILTQAACAVNLVLARAVRAGKVEPRERVAHKPTPPDPWGERHVVRREEPT